MDHLRFALVIQPPRRGAVHSASAASRFFAVIGLDEAWLRRFASHVSKLRNPTHIVGLLKSGCTVLGLQGTVKVTPERKAYRATI